MSETASGPAAVAVGVQWAVKQIEELLNAGVPGVHLYILNRADIAIAPAMSRCFTKFR